MAKSKKEDLPQEDPKEEISKESKEYVDKKTDAFLDEKPEIEEKPKEEEEPKEEPKEVEEKAPEIDVEQLKAETVAEVKNEIIQSLTGKSEDDIAEASPWKKEGRNPHDYEEVAAWSKDQALKEFNAQQEAVTAQAAEQETANQDQIKQNFGKWNEYWDEQLNDLRTQGKLPQVENKDENSADYAKDPGVVARKDLFKQMYENNIKRSQSGLKIITSIKEFYYEGYKKVSDQPAGADAPVSGGSTPVESKSDDDFSYDSVHNTKTFRDVIGKKT